MAEYVRTFWKGYLRLALVNIPIRLVTAEKSEAEIHFHQVDKKTKQRIKYLKVVPGKGEVKKQDIAMAYEIEPGKYVFMDDDDLENLKLKSRQTVDLVQFVDPDDIDPLYFERPYYVLPDGEVAEEGYRVVRDALKKSRKIGIGQLVLRGRENLVALYPGGNGLVLDTLRYESEIKDADEVFQNIGRAESKRDMMEMAADLIEQRTERFDATKFKNHYAAALKDLVHEKMKKGETVPVQESEDVKEGKVIDFMDALKRSVSQSSGKGLSRDKRPDRPAPTTRRTARKPARKLKSA